MFSLSKALGFSLDTPWKDLPDARAQAILYGIEPKKIKLRHPAGRQGDARRAGRQGDRLRRHRPPHRALLPPLPPARRGQLADGGLARQGDGRAHLSGLQRRARCARRGCCSPIGGKTIHDVGQLHFDELHAFLGTIKPAGRGADAGRQVLEAKSAAGWSCCSASVSTTSTSTAARARSRAANRSAFACRRRSAPA